MVLVALCLTLVLGVAVAGYVAVCARTMEMSNRSFCYTGSVLLAENGMEEALWSLHQALNYPGYSWSGWDAPTIDPITNHPTITKTLTGFLTNKGIQGQIKISIDNYNIDQGTITPLSYTQPLKITVDGISLMPGGIKIDKQLVAQVKPAALFSNAVGAVDLTLNPSVDFSSSSSGTVVDSYDSAPTAPNNGIYTPYPYADPSIVNRSHLAIISGARLNIRNAVILGYATTANSSSTLPSFDTSGTVTSLTPTGDTSTFPPIDYSRISNNANQYAFDIKQDSDLPGNYAGDDSAINLAIIGDYPIGTPSTTVPKRYVVSSLFLANSDKLTIAGPVIIKVAGDLTIQDSAKIVISDNATPTNYTDDGSLQIVVDGNINIGGRGVDNKPARPRNFVIFCTSISSTPGQLISTATDFYGAVYAPNSPLVVNGNPTVYGALVGQSVTFNGTPTIHYDLDLRKATFSVVNTPYDVAQWIVSN